MTGYSVKIDYTMKELSPKEKIMLKDFSGAVSLDEVTKAQGEVVISVVNYAICNVHNERSSGDKDYIKYVLMDESGVRYVTGSEAVMSSLEGIADEYKEAGLDEAIKIRVYRRKSKNYNGDFITCSLI